MDYKILKHQEKAFYKGERLHILEYPGICQIFIFACICADAFTLFSTFDLFLTQQIYYMGNYHYCGVCNEYYTYVAGGKSSE